MRKIVFFVTFMLLTVLMLYGQVPQLFTYQAVVRDANGRLVSSATVGVRISILQGGENGPTVYSQTESVRTNANGLFSIIIGGDGMGLIDWGNGVFYLHSEVDPDGGHNYSLTTTQQILSVPYAIRAHTVDSIIGGVNFTETDPVFLAWNKSYDDLINKPEIPVVPDSISAFVNDVGYLTSFTETQVLSISNDTIYLTGGSYVKLPAGFSGDYDSLVNKPVIPVVPDSISAFVNDVGYITSFTESQVLSISNDTIYLTGGSFVKLPAGFSGDYDSLVNKPEIPVIPDSISAFVNDVGYLTSFTETQVLSISNDTVYLTGGSYVKLPAGFSGDYDSLVNKPVIPVVPDSISAFVNDIGYITSFTETQVLSISNDTIYLTGGSFVKLPAGFSGDYDSLVNKPVIPVVPDSISAFVNDIGYITSFTETQVLSISNDTIYLTGGSFVKLPVSFSGDYNDLTNKPTLFGGDYDSLIHKPVIPVVPDSISAFVNDVGYITSFTETQVLSISNDTIYLTGGSFVKLPVSFSGDYNDLTNKPTLFGGDYDSLIHKPVIPVVPDSISAFVNDVGYITSFTETQVLSISNDTIYLTGGSFVKLPAGFSGDYNGLINKPTLPVVPDSISAFVNDAGYLTTFTETQILSISNDTVFLTGGSYVKLPSGFSGDYNDLTNKPMLFGGDYNSLVNKPVIPVVPDSISAFVNDIGYITSFTETQVLSISNDTIYLTGGSFVKLPAGFSGNYNDLINKPTFFGGDYDSLIHKPVIPVVPDSISAFVNDVGYITSFTETQVLSISNDTIYLTGGSFVKLPVSFSGDYNDLTNKPTLFGGDYDSLIHKPVIPVVPDSISAFVNDVGYITSFTESQVLSISNDTVYLTGGSFVKLPVGFSGDYNDLTNKPTLFSGDYDSLINKPFIPVVPDSISAFVNDAGYLTSYIETQTLADVAAHGNSVNSQIKSVSDPTDSLDAVNLRTLYRILSQITHRYDSIINLQSQTIDSLVDIQNSFNPQGDLSGVFSVSENKTVKFSKGNLLYTTSGTHRTQGNERASGTYRFTEHQYDTNYSSVDTVWRSSFSWGYNLNTSNGISYNWGKEGISNGGDMPGMWRLLNHDEWNYLLKTRTASTVGSTTNARFVRIIVNGMNGVMIFPDSYSHPEDVPIPDNINNLNYVASTTVLTSYTISQFEEMESQGVVFLPMLNSRYWASDCYVSSSYNDSCPWYFSGSYSGNLVGSTPPVYAYDSRLRLVYTYNDE